MNLMKQLKSISILLLGLLWSMTNVMGQNQYIINGDAYSTSCDCYTLTNAQNGQSGSVWNDSLVDLSNSFSFNFDIFLGCYDPGADGLVFGLQPVGTNIGTAGGGMGMQGVNPSVGVYIDTYTNGNHFDPFADHISLQTNGDIIHDNSPDDLTPAIALPNMEDCNWHTMQVSWDAGTFQFDVTIDGTNYISIANNFVANVFSGNPQVYWGFTAATGGLNNQHSFCIQSDLDIEVSSDTLCVNEVVNLIDSSEISGGVASWQWDFGDGSPFETTPITNHSYSAPGTYTVELDLVDVSGCTYTVTTDIEVVEPATTSQTVSSSCNACDGEIQLQTSSSFGPYLFSIDNGNSFQSSPNFDSICGDNLGQDYNVIVEDAYGCRDSIVVAVFDSIFQIDNVVTVDSDCGANNGVVDIGTSSSGGSFPYLYSINGVATSQALPINNIPPSNQGTYDLVVTDSLNCTDTVQVTIDEINQPALNNPQVTAASCFGVCDGSVTLSGANIAQYSIDGGQNYQSNGTFTGLCQGTYNVMVDNGFGCLDSLVFTIDEPAELEISTLPADVTLCAGETFTADATVGNNIGLVNYSWEANGSSLGVGTPISFTTTGNMQICLTVSDDCPNTATECFNVIEPEPSTPAISSDVVSGCDPVTVNFENLTDGQIIETIWTFSDGTTITTNDASNVAHTFEGVGTYDVSIQVTTAEGCVFSQIWPAYIESFENPRASYTNSPSQASIFNTEVEFNSTSSNNVTQWMWDFSADVEPSTSMQENPTVFYPEGIPATYPVQLVVSTQNNCRDTVSGQVNVVNDVTLYAPNTFTPDNDAFNDGWRVWISGIDVFEFHLTLYNRWGEVVWESFDPEAIWDGNYGSAGMVPDGTYIWRITAKDGNNDNIYDFQGAVTVLR
jgi:gliding motility-associated-like protein